MAKRFYYSIEGTDVRGPVTEKVLRQLARDHVLSPVSYVCREGEKVWKTVDPALFPSTVQMELPALSSIAGSPSAPSAAAEGSGKKRVLHPPLRIALFVVCFLVALCIAVAVPLSGSAKRENFEILEAVGTLFFSVLIAYLLSLLFEKGHRLMICGLGMILVAAVFLLGQFEVARWQQARVPASVQVASEVNAEAQKQIQAKGYYEGSPDQSEKNLQMLKAQVQDDSEKSRLTRNMLDVASELLKRVKASEAAEKACDFDPTTIANQDDLATRRDNIAHLRDTQADVIAYLQNIETHYREALAPGHFSPELVEGAIVGARKSGHVVELILLWQEKAQLSDDHAARLDFLEKNWGRWQVKQGQLLFQDDATLTSYNDMTRDLQIDVKEIGQTQKEIFQ
jgi:hypothetical protein